VKRKGGEKRKKRRVKKANSGREEGEWERTESFVPIVVFKSRRLRIDNLYSPKTQKTGSIEKET